MVSYLPIYGNLKVTIQTYSLETWWRITLLVIFHILLAMIFWAYMSSMFVDPGRPPAFWV